MTNFRLNFLFKGKKKKGHQVSKSNHLNNSYPPDFKISVMTRYVFGQQVFQQILSLCLSTEKAFYYQLVHLQKAVLDDTGYM